jgi:hypothetical protein
MRRTVVRLVVLAGLLLLFPVAAVVLRTAEPPPPRPTAFALTGILEVGIGPNAATEYIMRLELQSRADTPWVVDQVFVTLLEGEHPVSTLIEDAPALEARHRSAVMVPAGGHTVLGPFAIEVPAGARGDVLLASVRLTEPASGDSATAQAEIPAPAPASPAVR